MPMAEGVKECKNQQLFFSFFPVILATEKKKLMPGISEYRMPAGVFLSFFEMPHTVSSTL
jgi:hypothetical protein